MPEELPPEFKLYVKEEIEQVRKSIKEDVEKAKIRSTKILSTVAVVVGLLTALGVYQAAVRNVQQAIENVNEEISTMLEDKLKEENVTEMLDKISLWHGQAAAKHEKMLQMESEAGPILDKLREGLELYSDDRSGYVRHRDVTLVWGKVKSTEDKGQKFELHKSFDVDCFIVVTDLAGRTTECSETDFTFDRVDGYSGGIDFSYLAIGK